MATISSEAAKDLKEFKRAWTHWYVQLGHICDSTDDWAFYRKLEAFIQSKILDEQFKFDKEQIENMEHQNDMEHYESLQKEINN